MNKKFTLSRLAATLLLGIATLATAPLTVAQTANQPFTYVQQMPEFEGGSTELTSFLAKNIRYPEDAQKAGTEGLIVVSFVIDAKGSLSNINLMKGLTNSTNAEALRVVKLMEGKWKPGRQNGKDVAVKYTLPIRFSINTETVTTISASQAQYKGGHEELMHKIIQNLKMPAEAKKEHLNARVLVKFTVDKDGSVSGIELKNAKLKKTVGPGSELDYMDASTFNIQNKTLLAKLAEAAAEAVKTTSGDWMPATKNGKEVSSEILLPLQFYGSEIEGRNTTSEIKQTAKQEQKKVLEGISIKDITLASKLDQKPTFKSGQNEHLKFFAKHVRYPDTQAEGEVIINFLVYADGTIGKVSVGKSMGTELKEEVLRVLELSKNMWQPGKKDGKPVNTFHSMTFKFIIDDGMKKSAEKVADPADLVITKFK